MKSLDIFFGNFVGIFFGWPYASTFIGHFVDNGHIFFGHFIGHFVAKPR